MFDKLGKNLSCKNTYYENVYPKGLADPDNQLRDKWDSTASYGAEKFRLACRISQEYEHTVIIHVFNTFFCSSAVCNILLLDSSIKGTRCCISLATQRFNIVDSHIYVKNNKKRTYRCVSLATMFTRTRHNVTLCVHCLTCFFFRNLM